MRETYTPEDSIAAIATALAPGAIGIVRTSGAACIQNISRIFSRPTAVLSAAGHSLVHGWIVDGTSRIDEVMLGVYRAPRSFTGEDMVEIFCHGGVSVMTAIQALLLRSGFRQAQKGEFTFRAYINGKTDLTRAEAVREIIESKTDVSRNHAVGRLSGVLCDEIGAIQRLILDSLAAIEVEIEYPEDEETIADSFDSALLIQARQRLETLLASWKSERLYQEGARVVLCGRTNAGKSSLFNLLLKEDRALVSDQEGTTRDWLECWASFDGIPVCLFDTAGLRRTDDSVEAAGIERTHDVSRTADLILYVADASVGLTDADMTFITTTADVPLVLVWNKCDKDAVLPLPERISARQILPVSAKTGSGLDGLISAVARILRTGEERQCPVGLGSERQHRAVCEALERVEHALAIASQGTYGLDAVVQDLEDSLSNLGEVTGQVSPEDVLDTIFSRFCVGK